MILDGKSLSLKIRNQIQQTIQQQCRSGIRPPGLAVILVGDDPASEVYVRHKQKACENCGIYSETHKIPANASHDSLMRLIKTLNHKDSIDGILLQLPLPKGWDEDNFIQSIAPSKDVDGLHLENQGCLYAQKPGYKPCTPKGIMRILGENNIDLEGLKTIVIGRSALVGRPIASLLTQANATVTIAHSRTQDLEALCSEQDLIIVAVGKKGIVQSSWLKSDSIVIDVGIHREGQHLVGDVNPEAFKKAKAYTPVPGGVGPMTIAMLLENCIEAWASHLNLNILDNEV